MLRFGVLMKNFRNYSFSMAKIGYTLPILSEGSSCPLSHRGGSTSPPWSGPWSSKRQWHYFQDHHHKTSTSFCMAGCCLLLPENCHEYFHLFWACLESMFYPCSYIGLTKMHKSSTTSSSKNSSNSLSDSPSSFEM